MAIYPLTILIIDLERPGDVVTVEIPKGAVEGASESGSGSGLAANGAAKGKGRAMVDNIWGDSTGRHLIVSVIGGTGSGGDAFYISTSNLAPSSVEGQAQTTAPLRKARHLRLRHPISTLAFPIPKPSTILNPASVKDLPLATDCLLGGPAGQISTLTLPLSEDLFNIKGVAGLTGKTFERDHVVIYTLPDGASVDGLAFGSMRSDSAGGSGDKGSKGTRSSASEEKVWIMATTKERLYELQVMSPTSSASMVTKGGGGWAEEVTKKYKDSIPKFQEIPEEDKTKKGLLTFWNGLYPSDRKGKGVDSIGGWISSSGLYHSSISSIYSSSSSSSASGIDFFPNPALLPYPSPTTQGAIRNAVAGTSEQPVGLLVTEWHFVFLFEGGRMVGVSRLTERVVWEEQLALVSNVHRQ